ncbi:MAG: PadR family transcriptional regulator [Acidimicrobiales bacterium]
MADLNLTPTSYVVLGLLASRGPSTPYELKSFVARSIGNFWSFPHAQLYSEPARLTGAGLLVEDREAHGRRRRRFSITAEGMGALRHWLSGPTPDSSELRDPGLLKLFFAQLGSPEDLVALASEQEMVHQRHLMGFQQQDAHLARKGVDAHIRATLRYGMRFEEVAVEFWREVGETR